MCIKEPRPSIVPLYKKLDIEKELLKNLNEDSVRFHIEKLKTLMERCYNVELISSEVAGEIPFYNPDNEEFVVVEIEKERKSFFVKNIFYLCA